MMQLATKTLKAIEEQMYADQGNAFRMWSARTLPEMDDAYRVDSFPFRNHMGASGIGEECHRKPWFGFRWVMKKKNPAKLIRLFNRGHLEEARFIAMLLSIKTRVLQHDADGNQFGISDAGGHFGGSGDGVILGCPDLPEGQVALLEFKTSNTKNFKKLIKNGVKREKWVHYVQMQTYMRKMGIACALYMSVNKETDELHGEIVHFDSIIADRYIDHGVNLVFLQRAPDRLSETPSNFHCKWCDYVNICHYEGDIERNCRTCTYSVPKDDGTWACNKNLDLAPIGDKHAQLEGCEDYERMIL